MKFSKECKKIAQIIAIILIIGGCLLITNTVKMDMGSFSGNGR